MILLCFAYIIYPILVGIIAVCKVLLIKETPLNSSLPAFSIIIPAFNEEGFIAKKIENLLDLNYHANLIQIIVVADGCTDKTIAIAEKFQNITLIKNSIRLGKSAALNEAKQKAVHELIVFTDADTLLNKDCLLHIAPHFENPEIGAVACEKRINYYPFEHVVAKMEGLYWVYESLVKQWESKVHSVIGAAGELFCIRASLYTTISNDIILDDFIQSSHILKKGYKILYEKKSYAIEPATINLFEEAKRKIRIGAGAAQTIFKLGFLPYSNWWLNFQFFSRRIIRWVISPIALIIIFYCNYCIVKQNASVTYNILFFLQLCFYILTIIGLFFHLLKQTNKLALTPFYFVFMNICMLLGCLSYSFKIQTVFWKKVSKVKS